LGEDDPADFERAYLEPAGGLSTLKKQPLRPLQKKDVPALAEGLA
jgi:uncharacterized membrane protein YcaP (DUF421 family)